jgi:hypothetical protein
MTDDEVRVAVANNAKRDTVHMELADVLIYALLLCHATSMGSCGDNRSQAGAERGEIPCEPRGGQRCEVYGALS